jgi:hypothetical protein
VVLFYLSIKIEISQSRLQHLNLHFCKTEELVYDNISFPAVPLVLIPEFLFFLFDAHFVEVHLAIKPFHLSIYLPTVPSSQFPPIFFLEFI